MLWSTDRGVDQNSPAAWMTLVFMTGVLMLGAHGVVGCSECIGQAHHQRSHHCSHSVSAVVTAALVLVHGTSTSGTVVLAASTTTMLVLL